MWIELDREAFHEVGYLNLVGKSLFLAQHFELNCKDVFLWAGLAEAIKAEKIIDFADLKYYGDKLLNLFLGTTIHQIGKIMRITDMQLDILRKAKESRNYIAHNVIENLFFGYQNDQDMIEFLPDYYYIIRDLAEGDNLVSAWSYEIHEKEHAPRLFMERYVGKIVNWVFTDFEQNDYLP